MHTAPRTRACRHLRILFSAALLLGAAGATAQRSQLAGQILKETGVRGGVVLHLGCGNGKLTAALRANERYLVHGLTRDAADVAAARKHIRSLGLYGPVSVEQWSGDRLPFIANSVNLIVAESADGVAEAEMLRVLVPRGVATVKAGAGWRSVVKPWPAEMDEWTHYLHGPSNNAVAQDELIEPVRRYQWLGGARYSRQHDHMSSVSAVVSANGRVFHIFDEAPHASILVPPRWKLIARDAFNGTLLWKRDIATWHEHMWPLKSGPQILARRLVAVGDRVYVTLGIDAPLTALDAATGETLRTYPETDTTEEILCDGDVLILSVAKEGQPLRSDPSRRFRDMTQVKAAVTDSIWTKAPRTVMAVAADTGKVLWQHETPVVSLSLTADATRVLFHDGERIRCLNRADGSEAWSSEPLPVRDPMRSSSGATLVLYKDIVFYSGMVAAEKYTRRSTTMFAISAKDGRSLWKAEHAPCGHMGTPDDILVAGGLVWEGAVASGRDSGVMTGRDPYTGEIKNQFPPNVETHWFHHRCYRAKATDKYLLFSRTGIEFIDHANKDWICHHWVRGACHYGIMPCNGLVYAPQHPCACYIEAKLFGFTALAPPTPGEMPRRDVPDSERLVRGPAFGTAIDPVSVAPGQTWPTFRGNGLRSGSTPTTVSSTALRTSWKTELGGTLSAPVVADGRLFLASTDDHRVHALDLASGRPLWSFTAGGRVDSPPTVWHGHAYFGSLDGHVYCLRASDGVLAWRYRAAPENRRMGAFDQLESVWPVHGSVLIHDGTLYCVAGRSMFLDGGLRFLRLDPATGRKLSETILNDRDPANSENLQQHVSGLNMPVALPDILSSDGKYVYMRSLPLGLDGKRKFVTYVPVKEQTGDDLHLFSPTGFLDDTLWHRTYWIFGRAFASGAGGYHQAGRVKPAGRLLVCNDKTVYGYGRLWQYYRWTTPLEFHLFAADKMADIVRSGYERKPIKKAGKRTGKSRQIPVTRFVHSWSGATPVQVTAMVLTGDTLFAAGPPDLQDEEAVVRAMDDPAVQKRMGKQRAAFEGEHGARLVAVNPADGTMRAAYALDIVPRFDGLIAADSKLYMVTTDGKVLCLGPGRGKPLATARDVTVTARPDDPVLKEETPKADAGEWKPTETHPDFQSLTKANIRRAKSNYVLESGPKTTGLALKQIEPITGRVTFRTTLTARAVAGRQQTGFLVFGNGTADEQLVKCGVRIRMKKGFVMQGRSGKKAKSVTEAVECETDEAIPVAVTVDPEAGTVQAVIKGVALTAQLANAMPAITHVGYAVINAQTEFTPIAIETE